MYTGAPYPIQISSPQISDRANEYLVTWHKPETGGRRITNYYIGYRRVRDINIINYFSVCYYDEMTVNLITDER